MDPELIKRLANARLEDIRVVLPEDHDLRIFLMLFGTKRMLIIKSTEQNTDEMLGKLQSYAEEKSIAFEKLPCGSLTVDGIRGEPEIVCMGSQPFSQRKKPDYWPLPGQRKMIVVEGITGSTDVEVLRSFLYVACLGGDYDRANIPEDRLPNHSGFVFLAQSDFPFDKFASITDYWREEIAIFDPTECSAGEETAGSSDRTMSCQQIGAQRCAGTVEKEQNGAISRYLTQDDLQRMKKDFGFLLKMVRERKGELAVELRGGDRYFNLYYRGNSLAKITFLNSGSYRVEISRAFYEESKASGDDRFRKLAKVGPGGVVITLPSQLVHPFFQRAYIDDFCAKIYGRNYREETTYEQILMTDNRERDDLILIDRQVTDRELKRQMDILALKQIEDNRYEFLVLELKLGKNSELEHEVAQQVSDYASHVDKHFDAYKQCYERVYYQKKNALKLFDKPTHRSIIIERGEKTDARIVVVGYSGMAKDKIRSLQQSFPNVKVWQLDYRLDMSLLDNPSAT